MKKLRKVDYLSFLNQVNYKFTFGIISVLIVIILYSCSSEEQSMNKTEVSKVKTESEKTKKLGLPVFDTENLNSFSEQIFAGEQSLDVALNKNSYVGFNAQAMQMLNAATDENDLKIVFEMAGIANSQEVIDILKNNVALQQQFIEENPDFYILTVEEQIELLNTSIELTKNNDNSHIPETGSVRSKNCAKDFNTSVDRCAGDFGTCAVFAVAGAYGGLVPGLLAAAYCMVTKVTCDSRAKQDYHDCMLEAVEQNPPSTGELTLHCDKDSCWTTDSNGKYVERVDKYEGL